MRKTIVGFASTILATGAMGLAGLGLALSLSVARVASACATSADCVATSSTPVCNTATG